MRLAPGDEVHVDYRKYPSAKHWQHRLTVMGEDGHGLWLGARPGISAQRGDEPPIAVKSPFVQLIPRSSDAWWSPIFNSDGECEIYVDIVSPARWIARDVVQLIDLDLDVVRFRDGRVEIIDVDEFELHCVELAYPNNMVLEAERASRAVKAEILAGREPFRGASNRWLDEVSRPD